MAVTLTGNVRLNATFDLRDGTARDTLTVTAEDDIASGILANQGNNGYQVTYAIPATSHQAVDLAGVLVGAFTGVRTFTKLKWLMIQLTTETPGAQCNIGGNANPVLLFSNGNDELILGAGGTLLLASPVDGYTVTAGTGDILDLYNPGATAISVTVTIVGVGSIA